MNIIQLAKQYANGGRVLAAWLGAGGYCVSQADAQRRADVCLQCPNNQPGGTLPGAVANAIREQVELKNKLSLRVVGEKSLLTCVGCGCVLKLKIHVPVENLGLDAEELKSYPDACWMKTEFKL